MEMLLPIQQFRGGPIKRGGLLRSESRSELLASGLAQKRDWPYYAIGLSVAF